jgi:RimJ/RimL family protein N-acetyltransferase
MIEIKEVKEFKVTKDRVRWYSDEDIERYIGFSDKMKFGEIHPLDPEKERHFEIFFDGDHVGDVRMIVQNENDQKLKRAELIIIVGRRNAGIGSKSFPFLVKKLKNYYDSIYCYIHKSNFRSVKLMKKNGFYVEEMKENELLLVLDFDE